MSREDEARVSHAEAARPSVPWLEWIASGIGLLLVLGLFGMIGWQAFNGAAVPPAMTVEVESISRVDGGYRVLFQAHNTAGQAAAQVEIEGKLATNGDEEVSRVVLDYIPGHSKRQGGLFFTRDPQSGTLAMRATGFAKP